MVFRIQSYIEKETWARHRLERLIPRNPQKPKKPQKSVLSVECLVVAVHGRFVVAFARAMFCILRGDAQPQLLSSGNTPT